MSEPRVSDSSTIEEVITYLNYWSKNNNFTINTQAFSDEKINGKAFLSLDDCDLKELGLSMGERKCLLSDIKAVKEMVLYANEAEDGSILVHPRDYINTISCDCQQSSTSCVQQSEFEFTTNYLKNILSAHPDGKNILKEYSQNQSLNESAIRKMIQILVGNLAASTKNYPTSSQKTNLAVKIIELFPSLKSPYGQGHEWLYGSNEGAIESRLKTVRRSLMPEQLKNKRRKSNPNSSKGQQKRFKANIVLETSLSVDEIEVKLNWLRNHNGTQYEKEIFDKSKELLEANRTFILSNNSVTALFNRIPRHFDSFGLIDQDFSLLFPDSSEKFLNSWANYSNKIHLLSQVDKNKKSLQAFIIQHDYNMDNSDSASLLAFAILGFLVPCQNKRNKARIATAEVINYVYDFLPVGSDLEYYLNNGKGKKIQPYLLILGTKQEPKQFFVIMDRYAIPAGKSAKKAIDSLFKSHWVFDIEFCQYSEHMFLFIEQILYEINIDDRKPSPSFTRVHLMIEGTKH